MLVVEDEEGIQQLLALLVRRAGGEPVLAASLGEARDLARNQSFDAVVVDKNLPDGSGIDLLRDLSATTPDVPVLVVTGYANPESSAEAARLGAFDYVLKPFDIAWVARRIAIAIEHHRLRAEARSR